MTGERWNRIQEIFHGALEHPLSERAAYVAQACSDDASLRFELESLLANDGEGATTLDSLVAGGFKLFKPTSDFSEAGLQIGPYRLVRELDSGGMGVVHLAVRSDDHYFQVVAVKTIRRGLEFPGLVQRFRAERQILATLNHPNIGAILDGGEMEDGRPFLVMEYVEGQPITVAGEGCGLSVRQRVELFRSVCSAVHYAHQKFVIHRDIKPSNVLVTPAGVVKLIDFGVSKPLAPELIPGELPKTETWQRFMTPDYASPEQLQGKELTTATDIYSLGVVLFELLTGSRPYSLNKLSPAAAERLVCEQEMPLPSSVAGLPERTRKQIAGDLDRIVLMAMDKDPARRYVSAQGFDEDLLRFLEHRPVLARKSTSLYRLSKFVQRHKTSSAMACATVVVLVGSILLHQWQSHRADRKVNQVATLADSAITDLTEKLQVSSASIETQASVFTSALQYLNQLKQSAGNDPRLLLELSKAYTRLGDLEGSPFVANLGDLGTAATSYRQALQSAVEAQKQLPGEDSTRAVVDAYQRLGGIEWYFGELQAAQSDFEQSLVFATDLWQQKPDDLNRKTPLVLGRLGLVNVELSSLEPDKALNNVQAALQVFGADANGQSEHDQVLYKIYWYQGRALEDYRSPQEAASALRKALDVAERAAQSSASSRQAKRSLFSAYYHLGGPLVGLETMNLGESKAALIYARKALEVAQQIVSDDSKNTQGRVDLGFAYEGMGDAYRLNQPVAAGTYYRKAIAIAEEMAANPHDAREAQYLIAARKEELAAVLQGPQYAMERLQVLQEANAKWKQLQASGHGEPQDRLFLMRSYCKLSDAELALNHVPKSREYADSTLPFFSEFQLTSPSLTVLREVGFCYESLANVQHHIAMDSGFSFSDRHKAEQQAREWYRRSADTWSEWNRRGVATPESEIERHKVERMLEQHSFVARLRSSSPAANLRRSINNVIAVCSPSRHYS